MNQQTVILLVYVIIVAIFLFSWRKKISEQGRILKQQAQKRNGSIKSNMLFSRLVFPHQDLEVALWFTTGGKNSPPYTHVNCKLPLIREYKLDLFRQTAFSNIGKKFGMQDIQINNPDFDDSFIIQGSDEMAVRNILSQDIQQKLLAYKDYNPAININRRQFSVRIPQLLINNEQYDEFIDIALTVIDKVKQIG